MQPDESTPDHESAPPEGKAPSPLRSAGALHNTPWLWLALQCVVLAVDVQVRKAAHSRGRVHRQWRWSYNTGGGQLLDWIGHHCDIAHWGCDFDNSGPLEVEGKGELPPVDAVWNTCTKYRIELK